MTFEALFWVCGVGLLALLVVTSIVLFRFGIKRFSLSFAVAHFIFVCIVSVVYFLGKQDALSELFWIIPMQLTLPVSYLLELIGPTSLGVAGIAALLAILGVAQYATLGFLIDVVIAKRKNANHELNRTR